MTDKEFKQLNRAQLIDIIYQLQLQIDELTEQNHSLQIALADKRLRINNAGNIAEAALQVNEFFRSAQNAAEQYLNEIKAIYDETDAEREQFHKEIVAMRSKAEAEQMQLRNEIEAVRSKTELERKQILAAARAEATKIIFNAQTAQGNSDAATGTARKKK